MRLSNPSKTLARAALSCSGENMLGWLPISWSTCPRAAVMFVSESHFVKLSLTLEALPARFFKATRCRSRTRSMKSSCFKLLILRISCQMPSVCGTLCPKNHRVDSKVSLAKASGQSKSVRLVHTYPFRTIPTMKNYISLPVLPGPGLKSPACADAGEAGSASTQDH